MQLFYSKRGANSEATAANDADGFTRQRWGVLMSTEKRTAIHPQVEDRFVRKAARGVGFSIF